MQNTISIPESLQEYIEVINDGYTIVEKKKIPYELLSDLDNFMVKYNKTFNLSEHSALCLEQPENIWKYERVLIPEALKKYEKSSGIGIYSHTTFHILPPCLWLTWWRYKKAEIALNKQKKLKMNQTNSKSI